MVLSADERFLTVLCKNMLLQILEVATARLMCMEEPSTLPDTAWDEVQVSPKPGTSSFLRIHWAGGHDTVVYRYTSSAVCGNIHCCKILSIPNYNSVLCEGIDYHRFIEFQRRILHTGLLSFLISPLPTSNNGQNIGKAAGHRPKVLTALANQAGDRWPFELPSRGFHTSDQDIPDFLGMYGGYLHVATRCFSLVNFWPFW